MKKNTSKSIPIYAKNLDDITGFQFTLNFDSDHFELIDIEKGILGKENFGQRYEEEGVITCSWIRENQNIESAEKPLFYLVLKAKQDDFLENNLWINSKHTAAEAYDIKNKINAIDLLFEKNNVNLIANLEEVILFQNQPNPFSISTEIEFYLPHFTRLEIQILDISGKIIHSYHAQHSAGMHQIDVSRNIFPSPGVYLYKLITPTFSESKKMILVN